MKRNLNVKQILWLLLALFAVSACSDSGISDEETPKEENKTEEPELYIEFESEYKRVSAEGGMVQAVFTTNVDEENIRGYTFGDNDMIADTDTHGSGSRTTRAEDTNYYFPLSIKANEGAHARWVTLVCYNTADESLADTIYIIQDGQSLRQSTDYSADKTTELLQQHTEGKGVPVVLMGDGFCDTEISDGTYKTTMQKAVDNLFSEQPLTALKSYFDIYMVNVVSRQNDVGPCYDTKLSTRMPFDGTTTVEGDDDAVQDYAEVVSKEFGFSTEDYNNMLVVVIVNNNNYAGTTYLYSDKKGKPINFSICYCPIIGGLDNEYFRSVLVHEAVGHGFGKLDDEYYEDENSVATAADIADLKETHSYGWYKNVSYSQTELPWADFVKDEFYSGKPEQIGAYEGGHTIRYGFWRPSVESMMNNNTNHFNAPSRKLIYDKVLEHNDKSASTFADFKAFDQANYPDFTTDTETTSTSRTVAKTKSKPFARPRIRRF